MEDKLKKRRRGGWLRNRLVRAWPTVISQGLEGRARLSSARREFATLGDFDRPWRAEDRRALPLLAVYVTVLFRGSRLVIPLAIAIPIAFLSGCASSDRVEAYHAPLSSVGARFGSLPAAVQNSIRAETGSAEIRNIDKEMRSIGVVYKISYVNDELYPPLFVAADGSVINPDMSVAVGATRDETAVLTGGAASGIQFRDLPAPVTKVVDEYAPRSEVVSMDKETWGSRVVYIVSFKNETKTPKLYIAADGTVLRDAHK